MQYIPFFKHQVVNDIAWSCFGPNIISDFTNIGYSEISAFQLALTNTHRGWLADLDQDPAPLVAYLQQRKSPRLGIYFEALWQFFLLNDSRWQLLRHNLPIYRNNKTFGEFDLIIYDTVNDEFTHLEIANKYYLNSSLPNAQNTPALNNEFSHWIGPSGTDRLDIKVNRLLSHQTQLAETKEGAAALEKLGIKHINKAIALKGELFYPKGQQPLANSQLSLQHRHNHWMGIEQFKHSKHGNYHWLILDKSRWISPAQGNSNNTENTLMDEDVIREHLGLYFKKNTRPLIIVGVTFTNGNYYEQIKIFVTPNNWPLSITDN